MDPFPEGGGGCSGLGFQATLVGYSGGFCGCLYIQVGVCYSGCLSLCQRCLCVGTSVGTPAGLCLCVDVSVTVGVCQANCG